MRRRARLFSRQIALAAMLTALAIGSLVPTLIRRGLLPSHSQSQVVSTIER